MKVSLGGRKIDTYEIVGHAEPAAWCSPEIVSSFCLGFGCKTVLKLPEILNGSTELIFYRLC